MLSKDSNVFHLMIIRFLLIFFILVFLNKDIFSVNYGSDTAVSIENPSNIVGPTNAIKTFAFCKSGFTFADGATSCTWESIFPVMGDLNLASGILYLDTDLILNNASSIPNLGIIKAYDHIIELSENMTEIGENVSAGQLVLNLLDRVTLTLDVDTSDWNFNDNYLAIGTALNTAGNELFIYSFDGSNLVTLTNANLSAGCNDVRWHPASNYLAVGNDLNTAELKIFQFNSISNILIETDSKNVLGDVDALAWHPSGDNLATGGPNNTQELRVFPFSGGTLGTPVIGNIVPNRDVQKKALSWAPSGNGNYLAVGVTGLVGSPELLIYYFDGASLTLTANANIDFTVKHLDWSPTGSYIAVGILDSGSNIRVYKHNVWNGTLTEATRDNEIVRVFAVNWKPNGQQLVVGMNRSTETEFRVYDFDDSSTPTLSLNVEITAANDVRSVVYSHDGVFIARGDDANQFSIYKPIATAFIFEDANIILNSNITLRNPITFKGNCLIDGQGKSFIFEDNGSINIKSNSAVNFRLMNLNFASPTTFAIEGQSSNLKFEKSKIILSSDVLLGDGSFEVDGELVITGAYNFRYESDYTSTIKRHSSLKIEDGCIFSLGKTNSTTPIQPLEFESSTSSLDIENSTLNIKNWGFNLLKGSMNFKGESALDIEYFNPSLSSTTQGLVLGDGVNVDNDPFLKFLGNSVHLHFLTGALVLDSAATTSSILFSGEPLLHLIGESTFYIKKPAHFEEGKLILSPDLNILIDSDSYLTSENLRIILEDNSLDCYLTGTIKTWESMLLDRNDFININLGTMSWVVTVSRNNNLFAGIGNFTGELLFTDSNSTLSWDINTRLDPLTNINLNGGRIIFTQDAGFSAGLSFVGTGTIDLTVKVFELGSDSLEWIGNHYWIGDGAILRFNNDVTLDGIWTLSGDITIDGNDYDLDLGITGSIVLERGARVTFKNISINGLSRQNSVTCLDDNCLIILNYADLLLTGNYLFDTGSISVHHDSMIKTHKDLDTIYTFSYASTQTSTINYYCNLEIGKNTRFSVGRVDSSKIDINQQPFIFIDGTSQLILDGGTLHITSSGMILTKGELKSIGKSIIEVDNNKYEYSLILGDGTSENDFQITIPGNGFLTIASGRVFYNNYANDRITLENLASTLRLESSGALTAKRDMVLSDGYLTYSILGNLAELSGAKVIYDSIIHIHDTPYSLHKVKSRGIDTVLLADGDYFLALEGYSAVHPIVCLDGTSSIGGNAGLASSISLNKDSVILRLMLNPPLLNNITLGGGTCLLDSDMLFGNDYKFTGSGKISLSGKQLSFGTEDTHHTSTLLISASTSGGRVDLRSLTSLSGTWTFDGKIILNGNGNYLDLYSGGVLTVRPGSTLVLESLVLKGLGEGLGNINFMGDDSTLKLINSYIELDNNFTTTKGGIYIDGPTTIGIKDYNWTIDQSASMTIDGNTLWKDPLGIINYGSIEFGSGSIDNYLTLISSGTIKTASNLDILNTDTTFLQAQIINSSNAIIILDRQLRWNSNAIVDQGSHFISLNDGKFYAVGTVTGDTTLNGRGVLSGDINLNGATLSIRNDLQLSSQTQINSSGNLDLYENALLLEGDITLPENVDLKFTTSGIIDGQENSLIFGHNSKIRFDEHVTVTFRNIKLNNVRNHSDGNASISILNPWRSQLCLENTEIHLSDNFSFTSGELFLHGDVKICGTSQFNYTSTHAARIASNSTLFFDQGTTFSYGPSTTGNRNLIAMEDRTSILYFNDATLKSTTTGLKLTTGTLIFDGKNYIYNEDDKNGGAISVSQAIVFDSEVNVKIMPAANIEIMSGRVVA